MEREAGAISAATRTPAGREGIRAFLAKEKPDFSR
jgi:enoyl-CoA hydratase/carnithine racemase